MSKRVTQGRALGQRRFPRVPIGGWRNYHGRHQFGNLWPIVHLVNAHLSIDGEPYFPVTSLEFTFTPEERTS
jgi:hypothetical protein